MGQSYPEFVVVYHYRYWDERRQEMRVSKWMATLECIRAGLGMPIIETGRKAPLDAVDELGRLMIPDVSQGDSPDNATAPRQSLKNSLTRTEGEL